LEEIKLEKGDFRKNIAVAGLGLIGGSCTKALRRTKTGKIFGIDIDSGVLDKAAGCGAIDDGAVDAQAILQKSDIVIIALYPRETIEFIKDNAGHFKPGTIITDTCGIKEPIIEAAIKYLPKNVEFVGGHPMAGNEFQGFDAASPELFFDTNYIITPHDRNSGEGIRVIERLAALIGCRRVTRVEARAHDRIMSLVSQLPHIVAVSFANLAVGEKDMSVFMGRSFMDVTRVSVLNRELWTQILEMNNSNIIDRIEDMIDILQKVKNALSEQDKNSLQILFDNAVKGKRMCLY
jgi:prephenate dehydrogenase